MSNSPKISIITPNFNGDEFLERTILSVINQNYQNLEYIIIDGASTDNSIEIVKKYEEHISFLISEPDEGLYYALNKGFAKSTGEIMCWINSDDILFEGALETIVKIFEKHKDVNWIQGEPTVINEEGEIIQQREPRYLRNSFLYKKFNDNIFIQQESTFWRRNLWEKSSSYISTKYRYAGDFELWNRFYKHDSLYVVPYYLGAFRIRIGQMSSINKRAYFTECEQIINATLREMGVVAILKYSIGRYVYKVLKRVPFILKILGVFREKNSKYELERLND